MARTYTKKPKMNTMNDFSDFLSFEEMDIFPTLDLCLPQYDEGFGKDSDDVFHIATKESDEFSTREILQELDLEGDSQLLQADWFTEKFDFNSCDPSALTGADPSLDNLTKVDSSFCGTPIPDLNNELLIPLPEVNITIPADMPPTPEQKVPEYKALSPYSAGSEGSSYPPSPCSNYSDNSTESIVSLVDLLSPDPAKSKAVKTQSLHASKRPTPYSKSASKQSTPTPKVKTPAQKQRKRVQNKDAATRYRTKKRTEQDLLFEEVDKQEKENKNLKDQVASISKEIEYLKNLMVEVYKTKQKQQQANQL